MRERNGLVQSRGPCGARERFKGSPGKALACLVAGIVGLGIGAAPAHAGFSSMYVFGDSLSATSGGGTQYPPPPGTSVANYWNGRFTNGRVWVEYLATLQGISLRPGDDYAGFGGGTPWIYRNLTVGNYYPPPDLATSLCIFWPACSDCFALTLYEGTNSWAATLPEMVTSLTASIGLLHSQGMRSVLIPNSVDVSLVPFFTHTLDALGIGAVAPNGIPSLEAIHEGVIQYNAALATAISQLRAQYPDLAIYAPDFFAQFNFFLSHMDVYGMTQAGLDALEDSALTDKSFSGPGANYVFWDYLHPTTKVHEYMATVAQQSMALPRISRLTVLGSVYRLDLEYMPVGRTGVVECASSLAPHVAWAPCASLLVTNTAQPAFVSVPSLGNRGFFRLNLP
jgi:hypothetical protein